MFCETCGGFFLEEHVCSVEGSSHEQSLRFDTDKDAELTLGELSDANAAPSAAVFLSETYDPGPGGVFDGLFASASDLIAISLPSFLQPTTDNIPTKKEDAEESHGLRDAPTQPIDSNIGSLVNGYELIEKLNAGSSGRIYKAFSEKTNTYAAIKLVQPSIQKTSEELWRVFDEARIASKIQHPNIVKVLGVGVLRSKASGFLIMELLKGRDLQAWLSLHGTILYDDIYDVFVPVCEALSVVHNLGIIHRDLKPENIFICEDTPHKKIKLLDFGTAKISERIGAFQTKQGTIVGTPAYMSPEQASGQSVDKRTDIYSFGVILYRAISGRLPFSANTPEGFISKHINEAPVSIRKSMPNVPVWLDAIIMKCLQKESQHRPQTIEEVAFVLKSCLR